MTKEAWNRWGASDEIGSLNQIGPEQVRYAVSLVRQGKPISLAQPITSAMLIPPLREKAVHKMNRHGEGRFAASRHPNGFQFSDDALALPLHSGTHIDCLCHIWSEGKLYNGFPGESVRASGAERCGAEKLPPIVTRGVLLDCAGLNGAPFTDGDVIGLDHLRAALEAAGTTLRAGDAVLVRTGWHEVHTNTGTADFEREPGLDVPAALFLAEAGVALVGADNYAIEVLPFPTGTIFPVHQRLIRDFGIPLLEGLVLKPLAETGVTEFLFMAAALPITGGTGSPLNPVAVL